MSTMYCTVNGTVVDIGDFPAGILLTVRTNPVMKDTEQQVDIPVWANIGMVPQVRRDVANGVRIMACGVWAPNPASGCGVRASAIAVDLRSL